MKTLKLVFAASAMLISCISIAQNSDSTSLRKLIQRKVTVSASLQNISDIDFVKREYKMELWLKFEVLKKDSCALTDLETQIAIKEAKEIKIDTIPTWIQSIASCDDTLSYKPRKLTKMLRVRCTMIQNWNVSGYPFDKQTLNITVYNPQRAEKWFMLSPKDSLLPYYDPPIIEKRPDLIGIENGWAYSKFSSRVESLDTLLEDPFKDIYYDTKKIKHYSAIHYVIPMERLNPWSLFAKLLIGMYVAFFVAFIALFIKMENAEVRFSLPVGGLFAAIANKYIMESILPQSPDFSLVDWLHSVTIIFILLIIAYSARDLWLIQKAKENRTIPYLISEKKFAISFAAAYFLISLLLIAASHYYLHIHVGQVAS